MSDRSRPHHRSGPSACRASWWCRETSLWFNLEVAAARYPDKAAYRLLRPRAELRASCTAQAEALAGWLQARACGRATACCCSCRTARSSWSPFYAILRADAVVVPVNPMNRADEFSHYITDPQATRRVICTRRPGRLSWPRPTPALPEAERAAAGAGDALRRCHARGALDRGRGAERRLLRDWLRADPPLPAGARALGRCAGRRPAAGPAHRRAPTTWRCCPTPRAPPACPRAACTRHRTLMHNAVAAASGATAGAEAVSLGVVPMFHITGMMLRRAGPVYAGAHHGADAALGPRTRRAADLALPRDALDLHPDDDHRPVRQPQLQELRPVAACATSAAAARRCRRRWRSGCSDEFGLDLRRRLRPDRDRRAHPRQPARARQAAVPGHPALRHRLRASSTRSRCRNCRSARPARSSPTARWSSRATGATPRPPRRPSSSSTASRFFRTGDLGRMDEEGYFFITDRLKRMINASGYKVWPSEVELLLFKCPLVQEACIIAARDAYRGETVKAVIVLRAEARGHRPPRRTSSTGRASTWRPTRCRSIVRVRRRAAQVGLGQGDVAAAAGPGGARADARGGLSRARARPAAMVGGAAFSVSMARPAAAL